MVAKQDASTAEHQPCQSCCGKEITLQVTTSLKLQRAVLQLEVFQAGAWEPFYRTATTEVQLCQLAAMTG